MSWFSKKPADEPERPRVAHDPLSVVRAYHERSKHDFQRYASGPYDLDWATQPDPFRRWIGAQLHEFEAPGDEGVSWSAAMRGELAPEPLTSASLSRFFYDSMALSAWKEAGESRWSLRVNPSSGNLHPTEAHVLLPAVDGLSESAGIYHYAPHAHGLEKRAQLSAADWEGMAGGSEVAQFFVGLTSIHWRESWKYGERAYRYCQHDAGHAIAALAIAAAGQGWKLDLVEQISSEELGRLLGTQCTLEPEEETPDALLRVRLSGEPAGSHEEFTPAVPTAWLGEASELSNAHVEWEVINVISGACKKPAATVRTQAQARPLRSSHAACCDMPLRELVRQRRSAVAMDGRTSIPRADFFAMLADSMPYHGTPAFDALPWRPFVHLALFVHRVDDLESGLYWLARDPEQVDRLRSACRSEFLWQAVDGAPAELPLFHLLPGNVRGLAARLCCQQEIAGNGAFSLGMIADFDAALGKDRTWFYPRMFWEAGAIGQQLYLSSELHGLRGTGIGCYFDDPVHAALGLRGTAWQSLYHFTIGHPVEDARLRTLAAYPTDL